MKNKSGRLLSMLIALTVLICLCCVSAQAAEYVYGDFNYIILDDSSVSITGYNGLNSNVNIPETIDDKKVTSISGAAIQDMGDSLRGIYIPKFVDHIDMAELAACAGLEKITVDVLNPNFYSDSYGALLDHNMRKIFVYPSGADYGVYTPPATLQMVCDNAFMLSENLHRVILLNGVSSIGSMAFAACPNLESVSVTEELKSIGDKAFAGCVSLFDIDITSVRSLGAGAFMDCAALEEISFGVNLSEIKEYTLKGCISLENMMVYSDSTKISSDSCLGLQEFYVLDDDLGAYKNAMGNYYLSSYAGKDLSAAHYYSEALKLINRYAKTMPQGTIYTHFASGASYARQYADTNFIATAQIHFFGDWIVDNAIGKKQRACKVCKITEVKYYDYASAPGAEVTCPVDEDADPKIEKIDDVFDDAYVYGKRKFGKNCVAVYRIRYVSPSGKNVTFVSQFDVTIDATGLRVNDDGVLKVYYINEAGQETEIASKVSGDIITFSTNLVGSYLVVNEKKCDCICHDQGGLRGLFSIIMRFIWKFTGQNQYCACGEAHYTRTVDIGDIIDSFN
ncbi:MAG: leucine-rich repeat domain-containing protein [Oscillospiraceae bacterium]|nr:leucine-rich repeat domain-containing protein [Oscillospiraceae bacterium]